MHDRFPELDLLGPLRTENGSNHMWRLRFDGLQYVRGKHLKIIAHFKRLTSVFEDRQILSCFLIKVAWVASLKQSISDSRFLLRHWSRLLLSVPQLLVVGALLEDRPRLKKEERFLNLGMSYRSGYADRWSLWT